MLENEAAVSTENLLHEIAYHHARGLRFVTLTCVDLGGSFEIIYHLAGEEGLTHLRLRLPKGSALPDISRVYPCAFLVENEIKDLFGVEVSGLPLDYGAQLLLVKGTAAAPQGNPAPQVGASLSPKE